VFDVLRGALVAWALGLVALGVNTVERFSWERVVGALALVALFLAAFSVLANSLL
jgi:hypothetical protein